MTPYYDQDGITIYQGDCREISPQIRFDVVITDPPYGIGKEYGCGIVDDLKLFQDSISFIAGLERPAAAFVPANRIYDLPVRPQWTGIWSKLYGASGLLAYPIYPHWEAIAFYNLKGDYKGNRGHRSDVFEFAPVRGAANGHPTPKPLDLMCELVRFMPARMTLDPFMGSGTTLVAAKLCGRSAIGVEKNERYCEIAANRLAQGVLWGAGGAA